MQDQSRTVAARALSRRAIVRGTLVVGAGTAITAVMAACTAAAPTATTAPAPTTAPTAAPKPTTAPAPAATTAPAATSAPAPAATSAPAPAATSAPAPAATSAPAASTTGGGTLRLGYPTFINPVMADSNQIMSIAYNGLVQLRADWEDVEPMLAESYKISPDGLTYTFNLRKNVKWHDGKPFTARDVEWTYKLYLTKETATIWAQACLLLKGGQDFYDGKSKELPGLRVVDDYTVEFILEKQNSSFLMHSMTQTSILPMHVYKDIPPTELNKPATWEKTQIGTGPFKFVKMEPDKFWEFTRNDDYFRGRPKIEKILLVKTGTTPEAMAVSLEKGELDYTTIPATEIDRMSKLPNLSISTKPVPNLRFFVVNVDKPYFKDKRIRQGLAYGIDRVGLCEGVLLKVCEPTTAIAPSKRWVNTNLPKYEYNPTRAAELLKAGGWDSSREIELSLYYADQLSKDYIAAVQRQLDRIGMKAKIVQLDGPAVTNYYYKEKKADIMYAGYGVPPDPEVMRTGFHSKALYPAGQNAILYSNPRIDELFDLGIATTDFAARKKIYDEMQAILLDELPWIPLHFLKIVTAWNKRVQNADQIGNVWNRPYNWELEKVVLADGK